MSIYINKDTKVITQGITGKTGQFQVEFLRMPALGSPKVTERRETGVYCVKQPEARQIAGRVSVSGTDIFGRPPERSALFLEDVDEPAHQ